MHVIADGYTNVADIVPTKDAEGQVLNRKIRARLICGFYPAANCGLVRFIQELIHSSPSASRSSTGSRNEHDPNDIQNDLRAKAISSLLR
jgi:hypothetical protein